MWESPRQSPILVVSQLGEEGVSRACERSDVTAALEDRCAAGSEYYDHNPRFMDAKAPLVVGYFSLEFGLAECLPIYSGGLGVLAGDHLKATSDLGLPLVAVGLLYKQGFGRQDIDAGGRHCEVYSQNRRGDLSLKRLSAIEVDAPIGSPNAPLAVWPPPVGRGPP